MSSVRKENVKSGLKAIAPLSVKTLVDQVVDAIVEATALGVLLPGDRIVEAEIARSLNVSRIPVREALRLLKQREELQALRLEKLRQAIRTGDAALADGSYTEIETDDALDRFFAGL